MLLIQDIFLPPTGDRKDLNGISTNNQLGRKGSPEGRQMATKDVTSKRVGHIASKILQNPRSGAACKSIAGSALVQRPTKRSSKRG
jgi:hypothetical protein